MHFLRIRFEPQSPRSPFLDNFRVADKDTENRGILANGAAQTIIARTYGAYLWH